MIPRARVQGAPLGLHVTAEQSVQSLLSGQRAIQSSHGGSQTTTPSAGALLSPHTNPVPLPPLPRVPVPRGGEQPSRSSRRLSRGRGTTPAAQRHQSQSLVVVVAQGAHAEASALPLPLLLFRAEGVWVQDVHGGIDGGL